MKKVSVLLPIYKTNESYLREAIESILNQTLEDFEFLIINDCPEDTRAGEIVLSYSDPRITYARNEINMGISATRNKLLEMSQGEYIAIMDHDDVSLPERFAKEVAYLDAHPEIGVVSCFYREIPSGKIVESCVENCDIRIELMRRSPLCHPAAMIRRKLIEESGVRYEARYTPAEDYALWIRLLPWTSFHILNEILFEYRVHGDNTSLIQSNKMRNAIEDIQMWAEESFPALYNRGTCPTKQIFRVRLFHIFPLFKLEISESRKRLKLFDFLPLLSIRKSKYFNR